MNSEFFKKVAIIGAGRMGYLFSRLLKSYYKVSIYDLNIARSKEVSKELNIDYYESLEKAVEDNEVICVATSLDSTKSVLKKIASMNCKNKLIFDIASFKLEILPAYEGFDISNKISSIHPMFGPGIKSTKNKVILIIPVKYHEKDSIKLMNFFGKFEFQFLEIDARTHDNLMSFFISTPYLLSLAYFKSVKRYKDYFKLGGSSFKLMYILANLILNDSEEQIASICKRKISKKNILVLNKEIEKIINSNKKYLIKLIKELKKEIYNQEKYKITYKFLENVLNINND